MRLWTLHPRYLDPRGLVALWREGLLAQAVLLGRTKGYSHHPQLHRFAAQRGGAGCLAEYLRVVQKEATRRGYRFVGTVKANEHTVEPGVPPESRERVTPSTAGTAATAAARGLHGANPAWPAVGAAALAALIAIGAFYAWPAPSRDVP